MNNKKIKTKGQYYVYLLSNIVEEVNNIKTTKTNKEKMLIFLDFLKSESRMCGEKFPEKEIFFIGGGEIYKQTIDIVSEIHLSVFEDECCEECDTYFPQINYGEFDIISREKFVGFKQFILKRK